MQKAQPQENQRFIVDGQQRLTTVSLLLLACRNLAARNQWAQAATIAPTIAFQNIATAEMASLRIEVGQNIGDAFRYMVQETDWDESTLPATIDRRRTKNLIKNYQFLKEKISTYSQQEFAELLGKLLQNTYFLVIEIDEALQAFDIFERTNARGAPLNIADLLKNRLFAEAASITNLSDRWDKIVKSSDNNLPRIFKYFDALTNGHDTSRGVLFSHLKLQAETQGSDKFLGEIEIFARFLNSVVNQTIGSDPSLRISDSTEFEFLYGDQTFFKRVKRSLDALSLFRVYVAIPLIYAAISALRRFHAVPMSESYKGLRREFLKTLNMIECFHFINNGVCSTATNKSEQLYAVAAKEVYASDTVAACKAQLRSVQEKLREIGLASAQSFEEAFSSLSYSTGEDKPLIAYIFDRMHQGVFIINPTLAIYDPLPDAVINRTYEIEHIGAIATWEHDQDSLNNIGNLLILTLETNRQAGQKPLAEKIEIYKERHYDNLQFVEDFVQYAENESVESMNPAVVLARAKQLANKAYSETWNPWQ